ncbi:MAG: lipase chaperone [Proteobacteria bacterium]|nr:lipase chaperone [Pseudomonadota bacterium]
MRARIWALGIVGLAAAGAAAGLAQRARVGEPSATGARVDASEVALEEEEREPWAVGERRVRPETTWRSLRRTQVDGDLDHEAGSSVPNRRALRLFDYFLTALGEEPLAQIRARIEAEIEARLPPGAAAEARTFLDQYLAYLDAARALARVDAFADDPERRLQWLRELRREHFGAELAHELFGEEENATRVALAQRRLLRDEALSPDQISERLAALEEQMPETYREARRRAMAPLQSREEVRALREAGGSEREVWALRESAFGAEAADRLQALDAERLDWRRRVASYQAAREAARDALELDPDATPETRQAVLDALRERHFDGPERVRLWALEAQGAEQRGLGEDSPETSESVFADDDLVNLH